MEGTGSAFLYAVPKIQWASDSTAQQLQEHGKTLPFIALIYVK